MPNILWMVVLTCSTCAIIFSAALEQPAMFLATSAGVSFGISLIAIREIQTLRDAGASRNVIGSSVARFMGLIWTWGALGLIVSYSLVLQGTWPSWWMYFLVFAAGAAACLTYSSKLDRNEDEGVIDDAMLCYGRHIISVQLAAMLVSMTWLGVNTSKNLLSTTNPEWVANIIFLGASIALAAISVGALVHDKVGTPEQKLA
jgi:hypothetical protein